MTACYSERQNKIKFSIPHGLRFTQLKKTIHDFNLHTICIEGLCPNLGECSHSGEAAFLIMGDTCTRNCRYCSVKHGTPLPPDPEEPQRLASAAALLNMHYITITSPTRDDLEDRGASFFAESVTKLRAALPECMVELLVPDFSGCMKDAIDKISASRPDVLNHNIEAARNMFQHLRPMGDYDLSLELLSRAAALGNTVKSGLMLGFGESMSDIFDTLDDLLETGCSMLTIGQYLRPHKDCVPVQKYYSEDEFEEIKREALRIGFSFVKAGKNVRSSYHARDMLKANHCKARQDTPPSPRL